MIDALSFTADVAFDWTSWISAARVTIGLEQAPRLVFHPFVVFLICRDPIGRKSFLCRGYIDLPVADPCTNFGVCAQAHRLSEPN